ncbi:hypothetical protein BDC45DRAFT_608430 [Circinella umbellata]|nr:hypothetical protein BDC45DRAFT_608430 [Circinella umbellata]
MNDNEQNAPWEFDAPKYYDFKHPELSSQGDDSWFDKTSVSPEVNRNRLRLRNRQQQEKQQHNFTLPHPSRPISVKPTHPSSSPIIITHNRPPPTSARRDIFTALASTHNRPSISSSTFSNKLSTQQQQQRHVISSVPESSIQQKQELARPIVTSSNQTQITMGRRDVVIELKRITDRFAKKEPIPTEITTINKSSNEDQDRSHDNNHNVNESQIDNENSNDNDKENVPPRERQQQQEEEEEEEEQEELLSPQPIQPRLPSLPSSESHSFWLQESNSNNDNDDNEKRVEDKNQQQYEKDMDDDEEEPVQITSSGRSLHDELQGKQPDTTISSAGTGRYPLYDNESIVTDNQMDKQSKHSDKRKSFTDEIVRLLDNNRNESVGMEEVANDKSQGLSDHSTLNNNDNISDRRRSWYNDETMTTMDQSQEDDIHPIDEESPFLAPPSTITTTSYRYQEQENKRDTSNVNKSVIERRPQRPIISLPSSSAPTRKKSRLSIMTTNQEIEELREKEEEKQKVTEEEEEEEEEEEKTVEESTRMRQWLDDLPSQLDNASIEKSRSVPQIKLTSSSSLSSLSTHKLMMSEKNTNNDRYTPTPVPTTTKSEKTGTTNNFDVLFERMATIRSELLHIAKTSAIKPAESDLMRNMERLKEPLQEREEDKDESASPSFNISTIEQRIARARRAIEESKRDSQGWFSDKKQVGTPPPPLLPTPASMKRKSILLQQQQEDDDNHSTTRSTYSSALLTTMRPNKVQKSFNTYPADIINNTTRRESMQHDISIAERVQNLKQAASRRASRVSIIPSYLPIEPTVPKSPRFATDTRSRLPT